MTVPGGTPGDEVPEADWAEQLAEAAPSPDSHPATSAAVSDREADEADVAEQGQLVDLGDDEP